MRIRFYMTSLLLLVAGMLNAQVFEKAAQPSLAKSLSVEAQSVPYSAGADELLWGYCDDNAGGEGVGSSASSQKEAAIYVPAEYLSCYKGMKITKLLVGLATDVTNMYPIISKTLGRNLLSEPSASGLAGWNTITLSTPYEIDGESLYIGYGCTGTFCVNLSGPFNYNGCWLGMGGNWANYAEIYAWKPVSVKFVIEGENFPTDMRLIADCDKKTSKDNDIVVSGTVENFCPGNVSKYEIAYDIPGVASGSKEYTTNLAKNGTEDFRLTIPALGVAGVFDITIKVKSINGSDDMVPANSTVTLASTVLGESFARKVVVEEGTGTWCPWCVRGIVGLREMKEKYPDGFIGIAVHDGDEMSVGNDYSQIFNYFSGFPSCVVNRTMVMDPDFTNLETVYNLEKTAALAKITASAEYADAGKSDIIVNTRTQFACNSSREYRIAYVVVENGVGPYIQSNAYAGGGNGVMGGFESMGYSVSIMFDDVARGIYGGFNGAAGSVPAGVTEGTVYDYTYRLTLTGKIADKSNIELVALLIDQSTGEIVNADKVKPGEPTAIGSIVDGGSTGKPEYYRVDGVRTSGMVKGLNIVRTGDGSVRKVVLK